MFRVRLKVVVGEDEAPSLDRIYREIWVALSWAWRGDERAWLLASLFVRGCSF